MLLINFMLALKQKNKKQILVSIIMCGSGCILWLQILILHLIISFSHSAGQNPGNLTDIESLLAFKAQITDDPLGVLNSWNQSLHFCQWSGVTCGRRHQRVVKLDLTSSKLQGSLSPHVGNLSFLRTLDLEENSFTHGIPAELGGLFRIKYLILNNNTFSGEIPANISHCSNLLSLQFGRNNLTGELPAEIGALSRLESLIFNRNNLGGEIPTSLGNLSSIQAINGMFNHFQGGIPASFGQLNKLYQLALDRNNLIGTIPPPIYNLSSLVLFSVSGNQLHGTLPLNIGLALPYLQYFNINDNKLSGQIPVTFSNASYLFDLELTNNSFTGEVPNIITGRHNLRCLSLANNDLGEGEDHDLSFVYPLANITRLEFLHINDNNFGGELPQVVTNFSTNLLRLTFGGNQIRGKIPRDIGNLIGLERLSLEENQLSGVIPSSIGKLQKLRGVTMGENNLSGTIPSSLGNITSLITLDLGQNNLQGRIPSSLRNCRNLLGLSLGLNRLSGFIPDEVVGISSLSLYLDLSGNQLTGSLPLQVGKLVNLGCLNISNNKLSGEIPSTLAACIRLEILHLGGNSFHGNIPMTLSALKGIQYLNFSNNNLSGQIPDFFGDFMSLESLNLSFNGFEGEVPVNGAFKNASKISIIGNKNLCGGVPQLNLPKCSSVEVNKQKPFAKRALIAAVASGCLGLIFIICFLAFCYFKKTRNELPTSYSLQKSLLRVTYRDLYQATNGFSSSNLIGGGGFGSVYRGILDSNGMVVAVKVLNLLHEGAFKSFMAECKAWTSIRHRNLVKVLSACSSIDFQGNDFKALVYEFMVNGNLDEWLHPVGSSNQTQEPRNLNLLQRLNIVVDIANALDYLHHHCQVPIIHCDLKPSNVLLDSDMVAHVGDFGIARFVLEASHPISENQSSSIGLKGTIGYAAPEYGMGSRVSTHGDVYSFGILLLEMFTGKRPTDSIFKDGMNLHSFVEGALLNRVLDITDPKLLKEYEEASVVASQSRNQFETQKYMECVILVLKVGVACSAELPRARMDISTAAVELHRTRDVLLGPRTPRQPQM